MSWMFLPFKRYFDFRGRSRRMEFWMFTLLNVLLAFVAFGLLLALAPGTGSSEFVSEADSLSATADFYGDLSENPVGLIAMGLYAIFVLVALIPGIAVTIRRLHDRDMSGWWYLGMLVVSIIPLVGTLASLAFLVLMLLPGTDGPNRFGSDPKGRGDASVFE